MCVRSVYVLAQRAARASSQRRSCCRLTVSLAQLRSAATSLEQGLSCSSDVAAAAFCAHMHDSLFIF